VGFHCIAYIKFYETHVDQQFLFSQVLESVQWQGTSYISICSQL